MYGAEGPALSVALRRRGARDGPVAPVGRAVVGFIPDDGPVGVVLGDLALGIAAVLAGRDELARYRARRRREARPGGVVAAAGGREVADDRRRRERRDGPSVVAELVVESGVAESVVALVVESVVALAVELVVERVAEIVVVALAAARAAQQRARGRRARAGSLSRSVIDDARRAASSSTAACTSRR